jgi:hypothetical protein
VSLYAGINKYNEDVKYPNPIIGETDKTYKKRQRKQEKLVKEDARLRFDLLNSKFLIPLRLHLEPVLRPKNPDDVQAYDCNRVAHIRLIGDDNPRHYFNRKSMKMARQAFHHDGYKFDWQLNMAVRFSYKPCLLVQAFGPSSNPKDKKSVKYLKINKVKKYIEKVGYNKELDDELNRLYAEKASGCFNKEDFLHYRFWFFDLDYISPIAFEDLCEILDEIGLFKYLAAVVETSPGKYHLYFHSELIASKEHVGVWPEPNRVPFDQLIFDPVFLEAIQDKSKLGMEWHEVANRGMLNKEKLADSTNPLPVETPKFTGDNDSAQAYKQHWAILNQFLGGDPCVHNETRVAQLPFYPNPKTGYEAQLLHVNPNAPVMKSADIAEAYPKMLAYFRRNGRAVNPNPPQYRTKKPLPKQPKKMAEVPEEKVKATVVREPRVETPKDRRPLPASPLQYAKENGLEDHIVWDKDITGKSNQMLLVLAKYAWKYIDLRDPGQRTAFYEAVIKPYIFSRESGDIKRLTAKESFRKRYDACCVTNLPFNLKQLQTGKGPLHTPEQIREMFQLTAAEKLEKSDQSKYARLLGIIAEKARDTGVKAARQENGDLLFKFFVPCKHLKNVSRYARKLEHLENINVLIRDKVYFHPARGKRSNAKAPEAGARKCKSLTILVPEKIAKMFPLPGNKPETAPEDTTPPAPEKSACAVVSYSTDPFAGISSPATKAIQIKIDRMAKRIVKIDKVARKNWREFTDDPFVYVRKDIFKARYKAQQANINFKDYVVDNFPDKARVMRLVELYDDKVLQKQSLEKELHMAKVDAKNNSRSQPVKPETPDWGALALKLAEIGKGIIKEDPL